MNNNINIKTNINIKNSKRPIPIITDKYLLNILNKQKQEIKGNLKKK
jgi:hypothetical protein